MKGKTFNELFLNSRECKETQGQTCGQNDMEK